MVSVLSNTSFVGVLPFCGDSASKIVRRAPAHLKLKRHRTDGKLGRGGDGYTNLEEYLNGLGARQEVRN